MVIKDKLLRADCSGVEGKVTEKGGGEDGRVDGKG